MSLQFDTDLDEVKKNLLTMGGLVETNLRLAVKSLINRETGLVDEVLANEREIDGFELKVDHQCHQILALHQPVANDLRFVLAISKVNNELERMGDHVRKMAESAQILNRTDALPIYDHLATMAKQASTMVTQALDALIRKDDELAQQVWDTDPQVDAEFIQAMSDISDTMRQDSERVEIGLRAVSTARDLERIADIATNIAKDVIFLVRGMNPAHRHLQSQDR